MKGKREKERGKSEEEMNGKESKLCLNSLAYQACKLLFYIDLHVTFVYLFVCLFVCCCCCCCCFIFIYFLLSQAISSCSGSSQPAVCTHTTHQPGKEVIIHGTHVVKDWFQK